MGDEVASPDVVQLAKASTRSGWSRADQSPMAGRSMIGSFRIGAMVSGSFSESAGRPTRIAPTRRVMAASLGKVQTTSVRCLISPFSRSRGIARVELGAVLLGNRHDGKHVSLGLVHEGCELRTLGRTRMVISLARRSRAGKRDAIGEPCHHGDMTQAHAGRRDYDDSDE